LYANTLNCIMIFIQKNQRKTHRTNVLIVSKYLIRLLVNDVSGKEVDVLVNENKNVDSMKLSGMGVS